MRRALALLLLAGCFARGDAAAPQRDDTIAEIVRLEGGRTGAPRLLELAAHGKTPRVRARALLALGRQGDEKHVDALVAYLGDGAMRDAAAEALGLIGAASASTALIAALDARPSQALAAALGHVGADAAAAQALAKLLASPGAKLRAAAARALADLGKRKVDIPDEAMTALVHAGADSDPEVRYGVAYALYRARGDAPLSEGARAVLEKLGEEPQSPDQPDSPETRAVALKALAAHKVTTLLFASALGDPDWRVRVEAVRSLAATPDGRGVLAGWTAKQLMTDTGMWKEPRVHAILEAITLLAPHSSEADVGMLFRGAPEVLANVPASLPHDIAYFQVLAGQVRLGLVTVDHLIGEGASSGFPMHVRAQLALELAAENKMVPLADAWALIDKLRVDKDARLRAAAAEAVVAFLPQPAAESAVEAALADADPMVVGSVADALGGKDAPSPSDAILEAAAAALARAKDPEVATGLVGALCKAPERARAFEDALRTAHAHPSAAVRAAARECLTKVLGSDPGPGVASAPEPATPADPTRLLGHRVTWTVTTTQGEFVVALDPELAPWNVGTLTALAEKHFYDGTLWHRVVPDFVVQGGDPTGSGWGGPGYTVPAEASQGRYLRGTVGIADAGKDTGGSQWFVMHSAAPHLEQRYTIVGKVTSGMEVVDRLNVGDRIVAVRVRID